MGSLVCRAELDKKKGIILTVENGDDNIIQTIVLDGAAITTTVEGDGNTSTITQDQESISIQCKTFLLEAKTITCKSENETVHTSGSDFDISCSGNLSVSADKKAAIDANETSLSSQQGTDVKALNLSMNATSNAELKGGGVKVSATGLMDLAAGGIATLEGKAVNVKNAVNLG